MSGSPFPVPLRLTDAELLAALPKTPGDVLPGTSHEVQAIRDEITRRGLWPRVAKA